MSQLCAYVFVLCYQIFYFSIFSICQYFYELILQRALPPLSFYFYFFIKISSFYFYTQIYILYISTASVWTLGVWREVARHKRLSNPPPQFSRLVQAAVPPPEICKRTRVSATAFMSSPTHVTLLRTALGVLLCCVQLCCLCLCMYLGGGWGMEGDFWLSFLCG